MYWIQHLQGNERQGKTC